jgi:predicted PurR-regulated permease PerM
MSLPPPTDRQARLMWLALSGLAIAALVALSAGFIWGLSQVLQMLSPVLWPLAVAGVVAYLLDPVVGFLERRGMTRPRAIVGVFTLALLVTGVFLGSIVPQLVNESRQLTARIPAYVTRLEQRAENWMAHPPALLKKFLQRSKRSGTPDQSTSLTDETGSVASTNQPDSAVITTNIAPALSPTIDENSVQTATAWLERALPRIGSWLFGQVGRVAAWFGVFAGLALVPVYTFYFLLEKKGISSRWTDYLPVTDSSFKTELVFVLSSVNNYLIAFFRGQVLVATCDGILYGLGFLVVGLPYALLIGFMAVFLTMIPFLGAIITCVTALLIALVQFGDWSHPLMVLAVFACVQVLEGLVISPKIMGGRVGLHPVTIIIAVMVGTTLLGGLLGGILAIPLTAALRVIMFRYVWKKPESEPAIAVARDPSGS